MNTDWSQFIFIFNSEPADRQRIIHNSWPEEQSLGHSPKKTRASLNLYRPPKVRPKI